MQSIDAAEKLPPPSLAKAIAVTISNNGRNPNSTVPPVTCENPAASQDVDPLQEMKPGPPLTPNEEEDAGMTAPGWNSGAQSLMHKNAVRVLDDLTTHLRRNHQRRANLWRNQPLPRHPTGVCDAVELEDLHKSPPTQTGTAQDQGASCTTALDSNPPEAVRQKYRNITAALREALAPDLRVLANASRLQINVRSLPSGQLQLFVTVDGCTDTTALRAKIFRTAAVCGLGALKEEQIEITCATPPKVSCP